MIPFIRNIQNRQIIDRKQTGGCPSQGNMGRDCNGYKVSSGGEKKVLKLIVVMVAQLSECTRTTYCTF